MSTKILGAAMWTTAVAAVAVALTVLAAAGTAWAHVEVSPAEVRPGSAQRLPSRSPGRGAIRQSRCASRSRTASR